MKTLKIIFASIFVLMISAALFTACNRSESDDEQTTPPATGFFWRENDMNATLKSAGSSEVRTQYKSIFAFTGTGSASGTVFEINLTGVSPGTYDLTASGNALYFNGFGNATLGKVTIIKNDGTNASGTFEASGTGGAVSKVYGTFTDIPVK